ncbi:MAG: hypothetical protein E6J34_20745 [Chloroflexi bacterium]|nr:MAG: hypothetical protein E6J34_20745 [Chloroflexota bacterium]
MNVTIPRKSELAQYLQQRSAETGIVEGKLLVLIALEHLGLIKHPLAYLQGQITLPQPQVRASASTSGIRYLNHLRITGNENFAAFGEPD